MIQNQQKLSGLPAIKYRYHAFISYAHEDKPTVEWLRQLLATFWVPWQRRRLIFLDQESLPAGGGLSASLSAALREARFLIVCCSKDSAESTWVNLEIKEFLESHPPENVLACLVGLKTEGSFVVPPAVQNVQDKLGDELFKPDLRGQPEKLKGREQKAVIKEALALLAPLVDLPGKDELLDQRKKTLIFGTALLTVLVCAVLGWKLWDDRPASQINKILAKSPDLMQAISTDVTSSKAMLPRPAAIADAASDRYSTTDEWLRTLVLTGHANDALAAARKIEHADARFHALIEIADQLRNGGAIRHYIDHWGHPSWETVSDEHDGKAKADASEQAKQTANEAVQAANEVVEGARKIADANVRGEVLVKVVEALGKVGKGVEAKLAAHVALAAGRQIEDADARAWALVKVIEALTKAGQNDEATQIAAEAQEVARNIKGNEPRALAQVRIADALAAAGKSAEAHEPARKIENADEALAAARQIKKLDARIEALIDIAEALADSGRHAEAGQIASEALTALGAHGSYWRMDKIFRLLAKAGKNEEARQVAAKELAARQQLPPGKARTEALASFDIPDFLNSVARSGTSAEIKQVAQTVLEAAQQRKYEWEANRAPFLVKLVGALAQAGKSDEAVEAAGWIANQIIRIQALVRVAEELAKAHQPEKARQVINEAQRLAQQFAIVTDKSFALAEVAKGLARLHYFRLAREAVESQASSQDKLAAYIVIVREYASERNPALTQLFVGETPE